MFILFSKSQPQRGSRLGRGNGHRPGIRPCGLVEAPGVCQARKPEAACGTQEEETDRSWTCRCFLLLGVVMVTPVPSRCVRSGPALLPLPRGLHQKEPRAQGVVQGRGHLAGRMLPVDQRSEDSQRLLPEGLGWTFPGSPNPLGTHRLCSERGRARRRRGTGFGAVWFRRLGSPNKLVLHFSLPLDQRCHPS